MIGLHNNLLVLSLRPPAPGDKGAPVEVFDQSVSAPFCSDHSLIRPVGEQMSSMGNFIHRGRKIHKLVSFLSSAS